MLRSISSRAGCALAVVLTWNAGCGSRPDSVEQALGTSLDSNAILGFESPAGWTVAGGTTVATNIRTQGDAALAVANPKNLTVSTTSAPVSSTATALTGLASPDASFLLDVFLPAQLGNSAGQASLQLFISSKSRSLNQVSLGVQNFKGARVGTYRTVKFAIPESTRAQLAAAPFSDLIFELRMKLPGQGSDVYRLDNLRARAFGAPSSGPGQSVDLVAERSAGGVSTPGSATFPAGVVQVPKSFHVKLGSAGTGTTRLALGFGNAPFVTCDYRGASGGTSYDLASCNGDFAAGDLVGADSATLTIVSAGNDGAKIRAQLALNPVGDLTGTGIIPPMPTWWGGCEPIASPTCQDGICQTCDASSASQIVTDYFNLVGQNPVYGETVQAPPGEFAQRTSDGSAYDNLTGPPPPNDPPYDMEGHFNKGGDWDGYWRLWGNLTAKVDATTHNHHNQLNAELDTRAVVWGKDIPIAGIGIEAFTDSGQITTAGFTQQNSGGKLFASLFGINLNLFKKTIPTGGSYNYDISSSGDYDLPPVQIWIFSITMGVHADLGVKLVGNVNPLTIAAHFEPNASVGVHLEGGINLGVASGGVSANIDLIRVNTPFGGSAAAFINTAPPAAVNGCRIGVNLEASAKLNLSTLGGHVDLKAKYGICPLCDTRSWTLFNWTGVNLAQLTLFSLGDSFATGLPDALCIVGLNVGIDAPSSGDDVPYGVPFVLTGHAVRPVTPGVDETPINCGTSGGGFNGSFTWASTNPRDQFADLATGELGPSTGCSPLIVFANDVGSRTLTLNVTDQFGEAGAKQQTFNVVAPQSGPNPFISSALPAIRNSADDFTLGTPICLSVPLVHFVGGEFNGALPTTIDWQVKKVSDGSTVDLGAGTTTTVTDQWGTRVNTAVDWQPTAVTDGIEDVYQVTLTAKDGHGITRTKTITFHMVSGPC